MKPEIAFIVTAVRSVHTEFYQLSDAAFKTPKQKFHGRGKFLLLFMAL